MQNQAELNKLLHVSNTVIPRKLPLLTDALAQVKAYANPRLSNQPQREPPPLTAYQRKDVSTRQETLAQFIGQDPEQITQQESLAALGAWYLQPGNFYAFCVEVLDRDLVPQPHQEFASVAEHLIQSVKKYFDGHLPQADEKHDYLALASRGTYKSTVWNQCVSIYLAILFPNIRILIDSETVTKAQVFLGDIRSQLEGNPILIALYGNLVNKDKWNQSAATISSRTRTGIREATFMTGGVGVSMPGMHFDLIIGDDYVSDQNTGTFDQIQKVKDHIAKAKSLLDPGALHFLLGTFWHFNDPYTDIIKNQSDIYHIYKRSCGGSLDGNKPLLFPSKLTEEVLKGFRKKQGSFIFSCQYAMAPIPDGEQTFNPDQYNIVSHTQFKALLNDRPYYWFYLVDPAITEESKRKGDYTALSPYVVFEDGRIFAYRLKAGKWGPNTLIDEIYTHYVSVEKDLGPSYNGQAWIEAIAFQKLLLPLLNKKSEQHGKRIRWKEMKTESRTSKEVRIRAAVPYLENGDLYIVQNTRKVNPKLHDLTDANALLVQQAQQFPMSLNDDMIDNQGFIVHLHKKPPKNKQPQKKLSWDCQMGVHDTNPMKEQLRKMYEKDDFKPSDEDFGLDKDGKWS